MIRTDRRLRACKALLIAELCFIWGNSLMPGEISGAISDWVGSILRLLFEQGQEEVSSGFPLRKLAHFTEFAALGMTLRWLFGMLQKNPKFALIFGVAAASVDETIQIFVPDRGPSVQDVAIDSCGVLTGMILLTLGHSYYRKRKNRRKEP